MQNPNQCMHTIHATHKSYHVHVKPAHLYLAHIKYVYGRFNMGCDAFDLCDQALIPQSPKSVALAFFGYFTIRDLFLDKRLHGFSY